MIIAIDGSAASGKGTLAKQLAVHIGLAHLDTGTLYRAVALELLNKGSNTNNINIKQCVNCSIELNLDLTKSPLIRSDEVAEMASVIAAIPDVRSALLDLQRRFAAYPPYGTGAVLDGRDIGTVVLPDADVKFFIDANIVIRARRRTNELIQAGKSARFSSVLRDMQDRDARDRTREAAPLRPADDAIIIDTSKMDAEAVLALAKLRISAIT